MAHAFDRIVSGLLSCDRLSDIMYVSDDDMRIQERINHTSSPVWYSDPLEAFHTVVGEQPDRVLISYLDKDYTVAEVDSLSNGISCRLISDGILSGDSVAVMVPRSEWYPICVLGVLKAGAVFIPIDITHPDDRISFILKDSSVKAVLVTPETEGRVSSLIGTSVKPIDCTSVKGSAEAGMSEICETATILYTSGTTGVPKGTIITRRGIANLIGSYRELITVDDTVGLYHSFGFDAHMKALFSSIMRGTHLVMVPEDVRLDIDELCAFVEEKGITCLPVPTSVSKLIIGAHPDLNVRSIITGGEKLGPVNVRTSFSIKDTYGPTEYTATVSYADVREKCAPESLGVPLCNTKVYILDAEHRRVPVGAIGELFVSGYQISSGYLNNPEKNASAFLPNPFDGGKGYEMMYSTGDFFRLLPDGTLGIIGRRDGQVKVRGNRVETTEVEECIRELDAITDVTVQPITTDDGTKELCAYVVSSRDIDVEDVRTFVSGRKPDYMVPAFVIRIDRIPLNVNGKVDRRALPIPDISVLYADYEAPRNENERKLCKAFAQALGIERAGINDDFIRLGGDSLKAIRAASVCRSTGLDVKVKDIISRRTVRAVAGLMSAAEDMGSSVGDLTPTPLQSSFLGSGTEKERDGYFQYNDLKVSGPIDAEILGKAARYVVDYHDSLRLIVTGGPAIRPEGCTCFQITETEAASEEDIVKATERAAAGLSLRNGVLTQFILISYNGERFLRILVNHMAVDGVSWNVILSDLSEAIRSVRDARRPVFPPRTRPIRDWASKEYVPLFREHRYWASVGPGTVGMNVP